MSSCKCHQTAIRMYWTLLVLQKCCPKVGFNLPNLKSFLLCLRWLSFPGFRGRPILFCFQQQLLREKGVKSLHGSITFSKTITEHSWVSERCIRKTAVEEAFWGNLQACNLKALLTTSCVPKTSSFRSLRQDDYFHVFPFGCLRRLHINTWIAIYAHSFDF